MLILFPYLLSLVKVSLRLLSQLLLWSEFSFNDLIQVVQLSFTEFANIWYTATGMTVTLIAEIRCLYH